MQRKKSDVDLPSPRFQVLGIFGSIGCKSRDPSLPAAVGEWLGLSSHNRATRVPDSLEAMDFFNLHAVVSFSSTAIFREKGHQRNGFIRNRRAKTLLIESIFL